MAINGFAFTKILVSDLVKLERFYIDGLGLGLVTRIAVDDAEWELDETILSVGSVPGSTLNLVQYRHKPAPEPGEAVIGLSVTGIAKVVDTAVAAGGSIHLPVQHLPDHGVSLAYVRDPDGHLIELIEPLSA